MQYTMGMEISAIGATETYVRREAAVMLVRLVTVILLVWTKWL